MICTSSTPITAHDRIVAKRAYPAKARLLCPEPQRVESRLWIRRFVPPFGRRKTLMMGG